MEISLRSHLLSAGNAKLAVREILLLGFLSAILVVVQVAKALIAPFLPNIELVSLFIIVYTLVLGKRVFYIIYVFVLLEGTVFGFDIWWFSYLYIWSMLAFAVLIFRSIEKPFFWAIVSGVFGLLFGALTAIPYLFIPDGGIGLAVSYWVKGIIFDLLHCAGNVIAALLLFKPLHKLMKRLYLNEHSPKQP